MAISIVQTASNSGNTPTVTATFTNPLTAGNAVIACVGNASGSTVTSVVLSDSTALSQRKSVSNGTSSLAAIWDVFSVTGGQTTVAVTATGSGFTEGLVAYEVSGLTSTVDNSTSNTNTGTSWTSLSVSTTNAADLWVGVFTENTAGTITGPSSPWVNTLASRILGGQQITSGTGSLVYSGSDTASQPYSACAVAYEAAVIVSVALPAQPIGPGLTWRRRFRPRSQVPLGQHETPVGQAQAWPQQALPGQAWRKRFNLPEHPTRPSQQLIAPPAPPTSGTPGRVPTQRAAGQAWRQRFRRHPVPPGQHETPVGQRSAYPQQALPGLTWRRRFRPRAQRQPLPNAAVGAKGFLGLTSSATVVQGAYGASGLALTTSSTPLVVVPGTGSSVLGLTSSGAAAIAGSGSSTLGLTSAGAGVDAGAAGARLGLVSACTSGLLVKTLIVSIASSAGTDAYGNAYVQGLGVYGFGELVSPVIVVNSNAGGFFVEAS